MADIPKYIRIFNPSPNDEFVTKRIAAISATETALRKKLNNGELFRITNSLVLSTHSVGNCPAEIVNLVSPSLRKASSSFVVDEEDIQMSVCALLASAQLLEKIKQADKVTHSDLVFALCFLNGLSYRKLESGIEKFEGLRIELIDACREIVNDSLSNVRERKSIKDRQQLQVPQDETVAGLARNIETTFGSQFDILLSNSRLDREEIDVLWWVINGRSKILGSTITDLSSSQAVIISSLEIGSSLQTLPDEAFIQLACKGVNSDEEFTEDDLVRDITPFIAQIESHVQRTLKILDCEALFPTLTLLAGKSAEVNSSERRKLKEWANRILLEVTINSVSKFV